MMVIKCARRVLPGVAVLKEPVLTRFTIDKFPKRVQSLAFTGHCLRTWSIFLLLDLTPTPTQNSWLE